ncbi:hypothetical protein BGZ51_002088 [Haplosporangium sp. Z 767]|nr:hypothetical protein BGZ50_002876 [Haplosporangium sp. Z 11]KAF9186287.1 hypothetical protein BGZ51_002088 [Haplosporangium sp. Z 767]
MRRKNPLDLSEIRTRISLYLSNTDAISCAQVSKEWSRDFVYTIWHTIDFGVHTKFEKLDPVVVAKNGHHIRVVKGLSTQSHINALQCSEICRLKSLSVIADRTPHFDAACRDLIARNNTSLTTLELNLPSTKHATSPLYAPVGSIVPHYSSTPGSRLLSLDIQGYSLTHESLLSLIQSCPVLQRLELWSTTVSPGRIISDFQHDGLTYLSASVLQVFGQQPGTLLSPNKSLLKHFPNLETWSLGDVSPSFMLTIKDEMRQWCPKLNKIATNSAPEAHVVPLLADVFLNLRGLTFDYAILSSNLVHTILAHHDTLDFLITYVPKTGYLNQEEPPALNDHFRGLDWIFQNIPRHCSKIMKLSFHSHEMDMDVVERTSWSCKDIKTLYIRIRGLDTAEKINTTISQLKEARRAKRAATVTEITQGMESCALDTKTGLAEGKDNNTALGTNNQAANEEEDMSIEARVVRHLLQFDKLESLWLGTKIYQI